MLFTLFHVLDSFVNSHKCHTSYIIHKYYFNINYDSNEDKYKIMNETCCNSLVCFNKNKWFLKSGLYKKKYLQSFATIKNNSCLAGRTKRK